MTGLANNVEVRTSYTSQAFSNSIDFEPVIVTPCRTSSEFGRAAIRDRVFASRCEFSWRSETVSVPSGDGRALIFKRLKQTASFERATLHSQIPESGGRITRAWDGATFEIAATYIQSGRILCDLTEIKSQIQ